MRKALVRSRPGLALLALSTLVLVGTAGGCRERGRRPTKVPFATEIAYGRPATCPEDAVDPYGDGSPSPMDLRCSYADGTGGVLTQIRGRVQVAGGPGSSDASPGRVDVTLYRAPRAPGDPLGPAVAHTVTEPQGTFSLGAMLRGGAHVLVVTEPDGGALLVRRAIEVGGDAGHRLDDVRLVIPRPPDDAEPLGAERPEAERPKAEPRAPSP